ncbi:MAG TPA: DUF3016 domain-containing protein [Lacunisphaera sp.]|nr:DUF3016 domain-containing protein [Lacunisphaera sp.]
MKTSNTLLFVAALAAGSFLHAAEPKTSSVTVNFKESERFTDAASRFNGGTDQGYLESLRTHIQKVGDHELAPGYKLEVTLTDVDLAGEFVPGNLNTQDVRIIKDIYIPRITLSFRLLDADGRVVKEGERKLTDLNFMSNISLIDRNLPLYYDKALLSDWLKKELKS